MAEVTSGFIVFKLNDEDYAVPITDVIEVQKLESLTPVPAAPPYIRGIANLRGKIIVLLDLKLRFDLSSAKIPKSPSFIVVDNGDNPFALIVDEVQDVYKIPASKIKRSPKLLESKIEGKFIKGVAVISEKKVIIILDPKALAAAEDITRAKANV